MIVTAIQNELLTLPASERVRLIDVLWNSLSEPALKAREDAWAAEAERRIDAHDSSTLKSRAASDVFAAAGHIGSLSGCFIRSGQQKS